MTTMRKFSQRQSTGKLAKHHGMQSKLSQVPGLQGKPPLDRFGQDTGLTHPDTTVQQTHSAPSVSQAILAARFDNVRTNKNGSPNKQDMKRAMLARGFVVEQGADDLMQDNAWRAV